ncbi:hypothetical protein FACS1894127_0140 [Clostridia bacterium]|nr:hypothetical protein FACS1894127_0140 [Clostridia bacterium]
MGYEEMSPAADKWLRSDGSVTAMSGTVVLPADETRAKEYESRMPQVAKWLLPDGSVTDALPGVSGESDSGIEDAPADGNPYARKDEAWEVIAPFTVGVALCTYDFSEIEMGDTFTMDRGMTLWRSGGLGVGGILYSDKGLAVVESVGEEPDITCRRILSVPVTENHIGKTTDALNASPEGTAEVSKTSLSMISGAPDIGTIVYDEQGRIGVIIAASASYTVRTISAPLPAAAEISYDSSASELDAQNVQTAVDEIAESMKGVDGTVRELIGQAFSDRFMTGSLTLGAASTTLQTALEFNGYVIQFARTSTSALRTYVYRKDGTNFTSVRMGSYGTNSANGTVTVRSSENAANFDISSTSLSGLNFNYTWLLIGPGGKQTLVYYNFANWTTATAGGTTIYLTGIKLD